MGIPSLGDTIAHCARNVTPANRRHQITTGIRLSEKTIAHRRNNPVGDSFDVRLDGATPVVGEGITAGGWRPTRQPCEKSSTTTQRE